RLPRRRASPGCHPRHLRRQRPPHPRRARKPRACDRTSRPRHIGDGDGRSATDRGVGARRPVGRRVPSRPARPPDGGARGLLRGLPAVGRGPRCAARADAAGAADRLLAEPRPGRQSRARRPAEARRAAPPRSCAPLRPADAAALHGGGVRRAAAVPVLHRPHRPGDRGRDTRGAPARVREVRGLLRRGRPGPAGPGDVRALEAATGCGRRRAPRVLPGASRAPARAPARDDGRRRRRRGAAPRAARHGGARPQLLRPRAGGRSRTRSAAPRVKVLPGSPFPLGATWDGEGTNFSLFSENADAVELCLFDDGDGGEQTIEVFDRTNFNWHCYLPGVGPGQKYGYRVHGAYDPPSGNRFNPAKLVLDPYAKAVDGAVDWNAANRLPYVPTGAADADLTLDDADSAPAVPKCVVVDTGFDWAGDRHPRRPWSDTVIYELHVKGFTKRLTRIPEETRGTFAGLGSDEAIAYLTDLGVTAVELLPIHHIVPESFLAERGLTNYWGYSSIGYFAPHAGYAAGGTRGEQLREFKEMVKALHGAGIEVILDVVYNHTAEGNHLGPMLSFKGVDNRSYYRLMPDDPRYYLDFTGTGNSLNVIHPSVLRLIMDSLRYFVLECHVDGF